MTNLVETLLTGDRLSLSRLLTQVENGTEPGHSALDELFVHTGRAHLIGVTGAPGVGKSSLVNKLALHLRKHSQKTIAIIAVDPTSPFTGGAVLGDRVRMRDLAGDPGIFIRSMATRGTLGGLAHATAALTQVFDAAGFDMVLIETVGAGQAEVDIARLAHTTLVVESPDMGDDIQAIKAGILEIADILVINKADRPGLEHTERSLRGMLEMAHPVRHVFHHHGRTEVLASRSADSDQMKPTWIPPILKTIASEGIGIPALAESISSHAQYLAESGDWHQRERFRLENEMDALITASLSAQFRTDLPAGKYDQVFNLVLEHKLSPGEAVRALMNGRRT